MPPERFSIAAMCIRFQVMNVVFRLVRSRSGLSDPAGVRLGRYHVAEMLQAGENIHGAVLDVVFVARDETPADPPVVGGLTLFVEEARGGIQPLDHPFCHRAVVAEPDRSAQDEDVGGHDRLIKTGPVISREAVFAHIRPDSRRDVVVDRTDDFR